MELITREYLGSKIEFKMIGNEVYANATAMCKHFGKLPSGWLRTKQTEEYIEGLERYADSHNVNLVEVVQGGDSKSQGTWIHEKLILDLARWLDVSFRIWCDEQIATLIKTGKVEIKKEYKRLEDKTPIEILKDNSLALNDMFAGLGINIPKEIIAHVSTRITEKETGSDFSDIKALLNKQEEEQYHSASALLKRLGIKVNKTNMTLLELGLQVEGTTTMQKYSLTELGKRYGVERSYTSNGHQGYEIKWKESLLDYVEENIDKLPKDWIK